MTYDYEATDGISQNKAVQDRLGIEKEALTDPSLSRPFCITARVLERK